MASRWASTACSCIGMPYGMAPDAEASCPWWRGWISRAASARHGPPARHADARLTHDNLQAHTTLGLLDVRARPVPAPARRLRRLPPRHGAGFQTKAA